MVERISLVGLGKLGLSLAACIAESGIKVLGVDRFPAIVESVNAGRPPLFEPGLEDLLGRVVGTTFEATTDIRRCVGETEMTFILVQTPSMPDGRYGINALESVLKPLCEEIRAQSKKGHAIVVCSTIQPGTIRNDLVPLVEDYSGMRVGQDIHLAYNPELVALGTTIRNFREPDFVLIGADEPEVAERIKSVQRRLTTNNPPFHVMSTASAELLKITLNAYLTVKISYANLVSQIAARLEGVEIDKVTTAMGNDKRIGGKFLKAGPSFGGTCFPRDVRAFLRLCEDLDMSSNLAQAVDEINKDQDDLLESSTLAALERTGAREVTILGMAFKSGTSIIAESAGLKLAGRLEKQGIAVTYYDPHAGEPIKAEYGTRLHAAASAKEAVAGASVIVLHHGDAAYVEAIKAGNASPCIVVDCWGVLQPETLPKGVERQRLGAFTAGRTTLPQSSLR